MTSSQARSAAPRSRVEAWAAVGLAAVLLFFLVSGVVAFANIR